MTHVNWVRLTDARGRVYYYNYKTATSQWEAPAEYREPTPRTVKAINAKGVQLPTERSSSGGTNPTLNPSSSHEKSRRPSSKSEDKGHQSTLKRAVHTLATFAGGATSRSSSTSNVSDRPASTSASSMFGKVISKALGSRSTPPASNAPSPSTSPPPSSSHTQKANVEVRRHWGRPERARTMSEDEEIAPTNLLSGAAPIPRLDSLYKFRTSSSADLIELLNLTRTTGVGSALRKASEGNFKTGEISVRRIPSFLEMDVKSGKRAPMPRTSSKLGITTNTNAGLLTNIGSSSSAPRQASSLGSKVRDPAMSTLAEDATIKAYRPRRNTTNTILIDTLMSKPDVVAQIRCVSSLLHAHMVRFALARKRSAKPVSALNQARFEVFNDDFGKTPQQKAAMAAAAASAAAATVSSTSETGVLKRVGSKTSSSLERHVLMKNASKQDVLKRTDSKIDVFGGADLPAAVPDKEKINSFISNMFTKAQMEAETIIMLLIYVERLLEATKGKLELNSKNWQAIVLACLVLASKVWDDLSMWNADFSLVSGQYNVQRVNELEVALLESMQYNVRVSSATYAKYYFQLRSMRTKLGEPANRIKELSMEQASKLQTLSDRYQGTLGLGWEGPTPKAATAKSKTPGDGKNRAPRLGIRKRSNTLHEGAARELIERMHKQGPLYQEGHETHASLEQVVSMKHLGPQEFTY